MVVKFVDRIWQTLNSPLNLIWVMTFETLVGMDHWKNWRRKSILPTSIRKMRFDDQLIGWYLWYFRMKTLLFIMWLLIFLIGEMINWRLFCFYWEKEQKWMLKIKLRWISWSLAIDDLWDRMEELLYLFLTISLRYLRFWLNMVVKLILLELMWEIDDWMRLDKKMRNVGVLRWLISL